MLSIKRILPVFFVIFCVFVLPNTVFGAGGRDNEDFKRYEEAERAVAAFVQIFGEDHETTATAISLLGRTLNDLGNYAKAIEYYERALAIRIRLFGEEHESTATSLNNIGFVYNTIGDYTRAIEYLERSLAIQIKLFGEEHAGTAISLNNLGSVNETLGNYVRAIEYYERSLTARMKLFGEEHADTASTLNNLGSVYRALGDFVKTIEYLERALTVYMKLFGEEHANTAYSLNNLGAVYRALEEYEKARMYLERAVAVRMKVLGEMNHNTAWSINNLGSVYYYLQDYEKARTYHEHAITIFTRLFGEEHPEVAWSLSSLGKVYHALGDYTRAKESYERALAIELGIFGEEHAYIADSANNLGELYKDMGLSNTAIFYMKKAVNITQSIRTKITELDKDLQKTFIQSKEARYQTLADLLVEQGRIPEAQQVLAMLKEEEFFDFIRRNDQDDPRSTTASYSPREQTQADGFRKISENLFALAKEREQLLQKEKSTPASEWDISKDADRLDEVEAALREANKAFQTFLVNLDKELKADSDAERLAEIAAMNLDSLQGLKRTLSNMGHGAVLLHTIITEERLLLILTTPDIQLSRESPIQRGELFKKIMAFREGLEHRRNILPAARELYDIIIAPVAEDLKNAGAHTLMISLDGQLRYIPIAALHDGEKWLAEKYAVVVYTEAAKDKLLSKRMTDEWEIAALGVTKAHLKFSALPAVKGELESIVRNDERGNITGIPGIIRLDEEFTERAFRRVLNVPAVHVASHFHFEPGTVSNSFLLLGDGKPLTLEDINYGFEFGNVEQLTFSACNTAMGTGEGAGREVEGLGVLAQKQGAKSVAATLWAVADKSTGILMARFYTLLQQEGMTKAEALRQTQVEFIEGKLDENSTPLVIATRGMIASSGDDEDEVPYVDFPGYTHPYFWAPFILMGNWL